MSHLLHLILATATPLPGGQATPGAPASPGMNSTPPLIDPSLNPAAPGGKAFADIIGAMKFYALMFSLLGVLISGCVFGVGRYIANQYAAVGGRIGLFACLGTGVIVGGGAQLVQFAFNLGHSF